MATPEHAPTGGSTRTDLLKSLQEWLKKIFMQKKTEEEAAKAQKERREHETSEKRTESHRLQEEKEKLRRYHEARSAEALEEEFQAVKSKIQAEIIDKVNKMQDPQNRPAGSDDILTVLPEDALKELVVQSPAAAETVNNLLTRGADLYGSATELIKLSQRLAYEAQQANLFNKFHDGFVRISDRVQKLLRDEFEIRQRTARRQGTQGPQNFAELLAQTPGIVLSKESKQKLSVVTTDNNGRYDENRTFQSWNAAVADMITSTPVLTDTPQDAAWVKNTQVLPSQKVIGSAVGPIEEIWGEIQRREGSQGGRLTTDDLAEFDRKIREAESKAFPSDVPAGTEAYTTAVVGIHKYTEEKLNALADKLKERLRTDAPPVREGIVDQEEFLKYIVLSKGRFGDLLSRNPVMEELFYSTGPESGRFRNRVFLKIHAAVINDQRNSSQDNFGLYERADFTTFIDLLRVGLGKLKMPDTGESLGKTWADYYNNLSNTLRQARDIDFWASQPAATIDNFQKSLGMFQNEYSYHAMGIPAVEAAFRAYETSLRSIVDANDGYIPPKLIEYSAANKGSFWDQRARELLKNMISMGAVKDLKRDKVTYLHEVEEDGHTLIQGEKLNKYEISDDEIAMYMALAKGVGMASLRYLEMFAQGKVPGVDHPAKGIEGFHSMAYEGVAKSLNYFAIFVDKWKMGAYKYFFLMNQLVPSDKQMKITPNDSTEAIRAYMAYQANDGSFERQFGSDAKRFFDSTNFSKISSALGNDTLWRQYDMTLGWSDREREYLGGPTLLVLAERYAKEELKNYLVVNKYREAYRKELTKRNAEQGQQFAISGSGFDKLWREYGMSQYEGIIAREWDELTGKSPVKGIQHAKKYEKVHELIKAYTKAYKARIWIQETIRNPLVVAHNLKIKMPLVGLQGEKFTKLHNMLIQEILDIPLEDTKYGEIYGKTGYGISPTKKQEDYLKAVLLLEGDLAIVREIAIQEGRDLKEKDFEIIKDGTRRNQALTYWRKVQEVMLGKAEEGYAEKLYKEFGLEIVNGNDYAWDFDKIHDSEDHKHGISSVLHHFKANASSVVLHDHEGKEFKVNNLLETAIDTPQEWIMGTDSMALGKMDWLNLGSRQWLRRGGDVAAHEAGGNAVVDYLVHGIVPTPDKQKLAEGLMKIRDGYSGDSMEAGMAVAANLGYMTDRLYSWDWKRLGSAAQLDVWRTRRGVAAWMANGRREFWDALEHADVIPPHGHFYLWNSPEKVDIHTLRKSCHADNPDVWKEIITLGFLVVLAMTLWRAFTAPSEEESGGGGGGGGHH